MKWFRIESIINRIDILSLSVFGIAAIFSVAPFSADNSLSTNATRSYLTIICVILSVPIFIHVLFEKFKSSNLLLILLLFVYSFYKYFYNQGSKIEPFFLYTMTLYCLLSKEKQLCVYKYYRFFLIMMSCGALIALVSFPLNLISYDIVPYYDERLEGHFYANFYFSYIYGSSTSFRLCGLFNEPGYFGTILALYLVSGGLNLKNKGDLIMLITGIFTFSLAFFFIIISYYFLRSWRSFNFWVSIAVISLSLICLSNFSFENASISGFSKRLSVESIKEGKLSRTESDFDKSYSKFQNSVDYLFGIKLGSVASNNFHVTSYKIFIINYGIIGFVILYGTFLFVAVRYTHNTKSKLCFLIAFFLSVIQRPNVFNLPYFVCVFGGLLSIEYKFRTMYLTS